MLMVLYDLASLAGIFDSFCLIIIVEIIKQQLPWLRKENFEVQKDLTWNLVDQPLSYGCMCLLSLSTLLDGMIYHHNN